MIKKGQFRLVLGWFKKGQIRVVKKGQFTLVLGWLKGAD